MTAAVLPKRGKKPPEEPPTLPDEVADAWALVLIDIYEKERERTEAEHAELRPAG